jgi:hypothetical protein
LIIIDFTQIAFTNLLSYLSISKENTISEKDFKYIILNSIKSYKNKLEKEYGQVVLCYDSLWSWRRNVFKYYKNNRKKKRENDNIDWDDVFKKFKTIKDELKEHFPYIVIDVENAEADDAIAIVSHLVQEPSVICSRDHDFFQLHYLKNIKQFDIVSKKFIEVDSPKEYLIEHILKGDSGDGIPNILSDDDVFIDSEKRQSKMTSKKLEYYSSVNIIEEIDIPDNIKENYKRNLTLIDFNYIPQDIKLEIKEQYISQLRNIKTKQVDLFNYFAKNKLTNLIEYVGDFV